MRGLVAGEVGFVEMFEFSSRVLSEESFVEFGPSC